MAIVGIDLGTTNSCVAVFDGGEARVVRAKDGTHTMPSVVGFVEAKPRFVGHQAMRQMVANPSGTIWGIKRLFGRKHADPDLQAWLEDLPYDVVAADNGDAWVRVEQRVLSPQQISALVLERLKQLAAEQLDADVDEAVITVPAYFSENQRQAVHDAGEIAGLKVRSVLNEPTAAALAYGVGMDKPQTLAVFDLGGGTFDVTILKAASGVFKVLATNGDAFLGGDDFDRMLLGHLIDTFYNAHSIDLHGDAMAMQRLTEAAREAKIDLSGAERTTVSLPFLAKDPRGGPLHMEIEVTRTQFQELTAHLVADLDDPCHAALEDAGLSARDIDRVLLVGGMTRVPAVRRRVAKIFGQEPYSNINPDEAVALGAALQSGILQGELEDVVLLDVTPHSLGIRVAGGKMSVIVDRNTTIPLEARKVFSTTRDDQTHVDVHVYQGESDEIDDNTALGRFVLHDLPAGVAGSVRVEVRFAINADGLLTVRARDLVNGGEASIEARPSAGLTRAQVDDARDSPILDFLP